MAGTRYGGAAGCGGFRSFEGLRLSRELWSLHSAGTCLRVAELSGADDCDREALSGLEHSGALLRLHVDSPIPVNCPTHSVSGLRFFPRK